MVYKKEWTPKPFSSFLSCGIGEGQKTRNHQEFVVLSAFFHINNIVVDHINPVSERIERKMGGKSRRSNFLCDHSDDAPEHRPNDSRRFLTFFLCGLY